MKLPDRHIEGFCGTALILDPREDSWLAGLPTIPGPDTVDFNLEGKAEHNTNDNNHPEHAYTSEGGVNNDRANDIPHDQDLQPEENHLPEPAAKLSISTLA